MTFVCDWLMCISELLYVGQGENRVHSGWCFGDDVIHCFYPWVSHFLVCYCEATRLAASFAYYGVLDDEPSTELRYWLSLTTEPLPRLSRLQCLR